MKRRTFLRNSTLAASGLFLLSGKYKDLQSYHIAVLRGGSPAEMLDLGLEVFGNIGHFVKDGQKILVKPTMRWNKTPESGANTNPKLLAQLVERCYEAGADAVYLVDHTVDEWTKCYKNSGIERAVKDVGAKILPGNKEFLYQEVAIPNSKIMKTAKVHEIVQDVDAIINVPAVMNDGPNHFFGAFQNLMGLLWENKDYQEYPEQSMVDFLNYQIPVLNIMDVSHVLQQQQNGDKNKQAVKDYKTLILSADIVSAEAFAAKRLGVDPNSLKYLELAAQANFGQMNPPTNSIRSIVLKNSQL